MSNNSSIHCNSPPAGDAENFFSNGKFSALMTPDVALSQVGEEDAIIDSVQHLRETNHNLKLNDAILRNKIRKTEREIEDVKKEQESVQKDLSKVEQ